jgi:hypothetical protein
MSRRSLLIIVLMLLCYSYVLPRWADWSQTSRLALVRALVEQRTLRIDAYVDSTGDYALIAGHAYSDKAPGTALLATPIYAIVWQLVHLSPVHQALERVAEGPAFVSTLRADGAGLGVQRVSLAFSHYLLTVSIMALPAAFAVAVLDWLLRRRFRPGPALLGTLGYGLATPVAIYAGNFYSHALVASLLICAWALIEQASQTRTGLAWRLVGSGLLLGWASISEYPAVLLCGVLGAYALVRCGWRAGLWLILGGLPALGVLVVYDIAAFGTPWPVGYAHSALWQQQHHTGFMSLTYPYPEALWGLLGSRFRGLFIRAPWLLLALPGSMAWWRSRQRRDQLLVAGIAVLSLWLVYGSSRMWWGGFAAGPRYIVPVIPFLTLPAVWWLDRVWDQRWWRWLGISMVLLSLVLVWTEALAGQQFPPDSIHDPWLHWTLPAWQHGDIARNIGMALGLQGAWSLLPLLGSAVIVVGVILRTPQQEPAIRSLTPRPISR